MAELLLIVFVSFIVNYLFLKRIEKYLIRWITNYFENQEIVTNELLKAIDEKIAQVTK